MHLAKRIFRRKSLNDRLGEVIVKAIERDLRTPIWAFGRNKESLIYAARDWQVVNVSRDGGSVVINVELVARERV